MRERSVLGLMPRRSAAPFLPWITQLVSPSARWICALSLSSKVARRGSSGLSVAPLGKVAKWDATFYIAGQFVGGALGATAASLVLSPWVAHASVNYVITAPGDAGTLVAFGAEVVITFILMTVILHVSNNPKLHKLTGLCAGALVATYITVEAPISGMSMNPACAVASAIAGNYWTALWVYFTAPLRHAVRGRGLHAAPRRVRCGLRQAPSRECQTLHLLRQAGSLK